MSAAISSTAPQSQLDPVWESLRRDAAELAGREPALASLVHNAVLAHARFEDALSFRIAQKMDSVELPALELRDHATETMRADPSIGPEARADVVAWFERDPACRSYLEPVLFFKGFLALQVYRVARSFWRRGRGEMAKFLQMRAAESTGVDIHPGARIGKGIMIDHATGVVIGETAVIEDDVSMLHGVTLGGTGKEGGDRHPKVRRGALIGANATILGNIEIGRCSRVGAGSVVLTSVPACKTVAGVPAKIVGEAGCDHPSQTMDHMITGRHGGSDTP